jgi:methionine-rich copper-binding protein CopC
MKLHSLLLLAAVAATPGCISRVTVKKVEPGQNPRGMRYYLPQPVVVGRPKPDGGIEYNIEYIPNLEREYAVDAWSFMGSHTAKLSRSPEMLLTKAELIQNTTEVAKQLIDSAGAAGTELATQIGAQKTAERNAAAAAETARASAARTAATALLEKQNAVLLAQDDQERAAKNLASAEATGDATKIAAAQAVLETTEVALSRARRAVEFAQMEANKFDDPTARADGAAPAPKSGLAAGPVMYRIVEDSRTGAVRLVPMAFKVGHPRAGQRFTQRRFDTVSPAPPPAAKPDKPPSPPATGGTMYTLPQAMAQVTIRVKSGKTVIVSECRIFNQSDQSNATGTFTLKAGDKNESLVLVRIPNTTKPGTYRVEVSVKSSDGARSIEPEILTVK